MHPERSAFTVRVGGLLWLAACASTPSVPGPERRQNVPEPSVTIIREASYRDPGLEARQLGRLEVVVRQTDQPTQALPEALVMVQSSAGDALRRKLTDQNGIARLDSVPVGQHELVVRRIGYGSARAKVPVKPGCRTDVEAYIAIQAIGISPPPPMPGRIVVTTCDGR